MADNQPPGQTAQPPAADQRGTDNVPFTVKVLPAPDAKEQADKAEHAAKEKAVIDEKLAFETQRIADYTDRLAWFTFCLVGIAVVQAGLFIWQLRIIQVGAADATSAADAAQKSAQYLRNAERPFVTPFNPTLRNYKRVILGAEEALHVDLGLENIGKGVGFVLSYGIAHEVCADGAQGSQELSVRDQFGRLPLGPGSRWTGEAAFDAFQVSAEDIVATLELRKTLYVYGYIRYLDLFGITRRTSFAYEMVPPRTDDAAGDDVDIDNEAMVISVTNRALWYDTEEQPESQTFR